MKFPQLGRRGAQQARYPSRGPVRDGDGSDRAVPRPISPDGGSRASPSCPRVTYWSTAPASGNSAPWRRNWPSRPRPRPRKQQDSVLADAQKLEIDSLYKLPPLRTQPPEPDAEEDAEEDTE